MTCLGAGGALGTQASGNGCPPCTTSVYAISSFWNFIKKLVR